MDEIDVLDQEEMQAVKEVLNEFRGNIESGGWEQAVKEEARRRVYERRQAALRKQYLREVGKLDSAEARLRLRTQYRERGLDI